MNKSASRQLETRLRHFSTEDVERIVVQLFGENAYIKLINTFDREIVKSASIIRKGTTNSAAQEVADHRLRLALEMQEARRYRKTKLGKLQSHYLPIVHHLRNAEPRMSWPNVARFLKIKYHFTVSVPYMCRAYNDWVKRIEGQ